jgi:hypothetical protein
VTRVSPKPLLLFAPAVLGLLILCAYEARSSSCPSTSPAWFNWLFWTLGPLSVLALSWGVLAYGRQHDFPWLGAILAALGVATLWTGIGLLILVVILLNSDCLMG